MCFCGIFILDGAVCTLTYRLVEGLIAKHPVDKNNRTQRRTHILNQTGELDGLNYLSFYKRYYSRNAPKRPRFTSTSLDSLWTILPLYKLQEKKTTPSLQHPDVEHQKQPATIRHVFDLVRSSTLFVKPKKKEKKILENPYSIESCFLLRGGVFATV